MSNEATPSHKSPDPKASRQRKVLRLLGWSAAVFFLARAISEEWARPLTHGVVRWPILGSIFFGFLGLAILTAGTIALVFLIRGWPQEREETVKHTVFIFGFWAAVIVLILAAVRSAVGLAVVVGWIALSIVVLLTTLMQKRFRRLCTVVGIAWSLLILIFVWMGDSRAYNWQFLFYAWIIPPVLFHAVIASSCWIWRGFQSDAEKREL